MSTASWTSPRASAITLPISRVISCATSSLWSISSWPKRKRISPRRGAGKRRHSSNAARAAATARSTSSAPERGKTPISSPVAGLRVSQGLLHQPPPDSASLEFRRHVQTAELPVAGARLDLRDLDVAELHVPGEAPLDLGDEYCLVAQSRGEVRLRARLLEL